MHEQTYERARELGRMLGQTAEYKAVKTARDRLSDNRTLVEGLNKLAELETKIADQLQHAAGESGVSVARCVANELRKTAGTRERGDHQGHRSRSAIADHPSLLRASKWPVWSPSVRVSIAS
jgi:hypothetical protein